MEVILGNIAAVLLVASLLFLSIKEIIKKHRQGGCGGTCSGCKACCSCCKKKADA